MRCFLQAEASKVSGTVTVFDKAFLIDNLPSQIEKGDKRDKPGTDQKRSGAGMFGQKPILECSWRTWLRKLYSYNDTVVTHSCKPNKYFFNTGQAVIKHLERNHSHNGVVMMGKSKLSLMK